MSYLEEAAAELRKASKDLDRDILSQDRQLAGRRNVADGFAQLAAIEQGLLPSTMLAPLVEAFRQGWNR